MEIPQTGQILISN